MSDREPPRSYVALWLIALIWPIHWLVMRLYFRARVDHADRIPATGPVILAPTHRTRWDTLMLYHVIRRAPGFRILRFLTSHDEAAGGFQGWFVQRLGAFPINTRRPTPGALKHCREILLTGHALVIFPEGDIYRLPPGEIHPIKPGLAWIALKVQQELGDVPLTIVPIRLSYADRLVRRGARVTIEVREPLRVPDYRDRTDKEAIRALTADLQARLGDRVNPAPRSVVDALARGLAPPADAGIDEQHDAA